jgi:nitrous-oxide reductase
MATGGIEDGDPPLAAGVSQRDLVYMHVIKLDNAAAVAAGVGTIDVNGFRVIPLQTSI